MEKPGYADDRDDPFGPGHPYILSLTGPEMGINMIIKSQIRLSDDGRSLVDRVTISLREAILKGSFRPGEKLDNDLISTTLGVSKTPIREAIKRLEVEGIIDNQAHRGSYVANLTRKGVREIFAVRSLLEQEVVRLITSTTLDTTLDRLEETLNEELARIEAGDASQHFEIDVDFHNTLLEAVDDKLLKEVLHSLRHRIAIVRRIANFQPGPHMVEPLIEHRAIIHAIRSRNAEQAVIAMGHHMEKSSVRIQNLPWIEPEEVEQPILDRRDSRETSVEPNRSA